MARGKSMTAQIFWARVGRLGEMRWLPFHLRFYQEIFAPKRLTGKIVFVEARTRKQNKFEKKVIFFSLSLSVSNLGDKKKLLLRSKIYFTPFSRNTVNQENKILFFWPKKGRVMALPVSNGLFRTFSSKMKPPTDLLTSSTSPTNNSSTRSRLSFSVDSLLSRKQVPELWKLSCWRSGKIS